MAVITMKELLEAGVHFGHHTKRWNPKMKKFIFGERNGIYIIDLQKTVKCFRTVYDFVKKTVAEGQSILFVGTKRQAHEVIESEAKRCQMFYVNQRWLGGMLTNFQTIRKNTTRLKKLEAAEADGTYEGLTKKEIGLLEKDRKRLEKYLAGIKDMGTLPGAVYVVDTKNEDLAVREAKRLGIPVIAILDTNCDPEDVDYIIPGNDDALRSIKLITTRIADAAVEGLQIREKKQAQAAPSGEPPKPSEGNIERAEMSSPAVPVETTAGDSSGESAGGV